MPKKKQERSTYYLPSACGRPGEALLWALVYVNYELALSEITYFWE